MRRAVLALSIAAALAVTGCTATPAHPDSRDASAKHYQGTPADFAAIRAVLHHRAAAVLHHDRAAFLATIDGSDPGFVTREQTLFDNLQALPVRSMSYTLEQVGMPRRPLGRGPQLSPPVVEYVALRGADLRPVSNPLVEVFVRRHHHWLLAIDREHVFNGTTDVQSRPWGHGPVHAATREHVVVVTRLLELIADYHRTAQRTGLVAPDNRELHRVYGISAEEVAVHAFAMTRRLHVA